MLGIVVSFLCVIGIQLAITVLAPLARTWGRRQPGPSARVLISQGFVGTGITVAITVLFTLVLHWTGFINGQFYRPSANDYGQHTKLDIVPEDEFFESEDGTRLHGWLIRATTNPSGTMIHFHGSDRNITHTIRNVHWLREHGFNVFVFDYRGYGKSQGAPSRKGVVEDAVAAIEYVRSRSDVDSDRICLWGQSMGGQLAIVAAARAGTDGIRAVVAEATYASYRHHVKDKMAQMGPLWLVQWAAWLTTADSYAALDVVGQLAPTPILIVHGTADRGVRPYQGDWLFAAANEPKQIWRVPEAKHLGVFQDASNRERLVRFLEESISLGHGGAVGPSE